MNLDRAANHLWCKWIPIPLAALAVLIVHTSYIDEQTLVDSIRLVKEWREIGLDMLSVSIGFTTPEANIPWGPAFLAPVAKRVREEAKIPVSSAWGFGAPELADQVIRNEQLDVVMVGRAHLENPHWPYAAAQELQREFPARVLPAPYAHWLERYVNPGRKS